MQPINRRRFLKHSAGALGVAALAPLSARAAQNDVNSQITVACMGIRGQGGALMRTFAAQPDVRVAVLCDIDARLLPERVAEVESLQGSRPETTGEFREVLDRPEIDALVIGTPDHWHAIPTILACQAGKHVYVEKPCSHNIVEGQRMLAAARRHERVVQVGIQSRSGRHFAEAMEYIRSGALGRVLYAKGWESARQGEVPEQPDSPPPEGVDYDKWLGPAPERAFNPNRFHGSWRWFFDYGTGDLGNDGVHRIDFARRGLEAGLAAEGRELPAWPTAVTASGGKHFFADAQEWPDTLFVTWEYPGATLQYEMRIWSRYPLHGESEGAIVYGENGYVVIGNSGWQAFGEGGEPVAVDASPAGDDLTDHIRNFLECCRSGERPNCDIEIGHAASALCHMGNTSWRTGRKLRFDPDAGRYDDEDANQYVGREYRAGYELPEV